MPNENKISKQEQRKEIREARQAERRELILYRQKVRTELHKSRIKRDNLLSDLSDKMAKAKLKEAKLKAKLREQSIKEKKIMAKSKSEDRIEIAEQRKVIREKQNSIRADRVALKQEVAVTVAEIKNKKLSFRKTNAEEKASAVAIRNEQRMQYRREMAELKVKNRQLKADLDEERLIKRTETSEKVAESKKEIAEEKLRITHEKEKLRNIKNEKAAIARAKRLEKMEKAKAEKEKIRTEKIKARELHKQEILDIKANRVKNANKNAVEYKEAKEETEEEINEINANIASDRQEIVETKQEADSVVNGWSSNTEEKQDFSDNYHSAFTEEAEEKTSEAKEKEENSYHEKIAGSVIQSFGKFGAKKFKLTQSQAIDTDISKYKKDIVATEMIESFRKLAPEAIKVKSLVGYIEILLDKRFTKEEIDAFHAHAITALLTGHSIRFSDGFIMPLRNGKKLVLEFSKELGDSKTLVEFSNPEAGEEINKLITKKMNAGGNILLANGLLAVKEDHGIELLQDTNFMKG